MTPPVISIIMPVFNMANRLESAADSVRRQTFGAFELLLVDDGSTDGSAALCDALALKDGRIRVLRCAHGGAAAARNAGLERMRGTYAGFMDADDWLEPDMLRLLYENSVTYDSEISACGFIKISNDRELQFVSPPAPSVIYTPAEALARTFLMGHMRYSVCNKLFHRRLFESIRFPEHLTMEDKATTYRLIHEANRVAWCPSPKYHYAMRPGSIMHSPYGPQTADILQVNAALQAFLENHYPALLPLAKASFSAECVRVLAKMKESRVYDPAVFEACMGCIRQRPSGPWRYPVTDAATRRLLLQALLFPNSMRYKD